MIREIIQKLFYKDPDIKYKFPEFVLRKILAEIKGDILDIGTGDGMKLKRILQSIDKSNIGKVLAIEINPKMYALAKENLQSICDSVIKSNIDSFETEKRFDTILMFEVLEHLENPKRSLQKIVKLLKDNGKIIITTPNKLIYDILDHFKKQNYSKGDKSNQDESEGIGQAHLSEVSYSQAINLLEEFFYKVEAYGIYPFHGLLKSKIYEKINEKTNFLPLSSRILLICRNKKT